MTAGAQLTLLPYAYLADPLPVYHQSQDTRTGVHAYSYAGGPSAKEEVRGLDGVTRGSYSYVDAHGILQSVFYVADEGGFRVAATNLPTDGDLPLETGEVLLARNAHLEEHTRAAVNGKEERASRRKRSLEAAADQDHRQLENPQSSPQDQTDREPAKVSPKSSHESVTPEKKADVGQSGRSAAESVVTPVYGLDSILIPRLAGIATSYQNRVDIHNNLRLKAVEPVEAIDVLSEPAYETVILPGQVPLAISHQSRVQVHNNLRVETPDKLAENSETIAAQPTAVKYQLETLPLVTALPDYNRIQLHKSLGLEGPNRKDAVKIDAVQLALVETPIAAVPAVPVVTVKKALPVVAAKETFPVVTIKETLPVVTAKEALPVITAVSSQSRTQIHRNAKLELAVPTIVNEPTVYVATSYVQPTIANWPILAPIAQSSQYRSQIHSSEKIELTK